MVNRLRLWDSFKQQLTIIGIALFITAGLPALTEFAGRDKASIPFVLELEQIGYYLLRGSPVVLILLLLYNLWGAKRKQKQINLKIANEGVTYLMLPRPDGESVAASNVTLWHRIALAMPYYKHISFEMTGGEDEIVFSLRTTEDTEARNILSKVMAEWPGTLMRPVVNDPIPEEAHLLEIKPTTKDQPIVASTPDPLKALLTEISVLPKGIKAGIQVMVREDPFTRLSHLRRADKKTRDPNSQDMPLMINNQPNKQYQYRSSAEEKREIRHLDERAQEAFLEARIVIWAACDDDQVAKQTAIRLAETVAAQYHPNNKLIKGWRCKKGSVRDRTFPTFAGSPWVAKELGTIAHLVGKDALLIAPQLKGAPARPLPALPECRLPQNCKAAIYLLVDENSFDMPQPLVHEKDSEELPILFNEELPMLIIENDEELPILIIEDDEELPMLMNRIKK